MRIATTAVMLLSLASHRAFAQGSGTVAIAVDSTVPGDKNPAAFRSAVSTRVVAGFDSFNLQLSAITDSKTIETVRNCEVTDCLHDIAKSLDIALVVQVKLQAKKTTKKGRHDYTISMIAARVRPDRNAWHEKAECTECDAAEAKEQVFLLAGAIGERIKTESRPAPPPPAPIVLTAPPMPVRPPPPVYAVPQPPPEQKRGWYVPRSVSVSALAAGLVLVGTGAYLVHIDGQGTCNPAPLQWKCQRSYDTGAPGIGMLVGGGLAAAGGIVGLLFLGPSGQSQHIAIAVTTSSISVMGGF